MNFMKTARVLSALLLLSIGSFWGTAGAAEQFITIGTGSDPGVYYAAGAGICRLVNAKRADYGIRCHVGSSAGSIYNLPPLRRGEIEFGIVQSDWQFYAYNGSKRFSKEGPFKDMRAVFSLHAEQFTVVARADAGIAKFADLKGRRVNIGNPGSGQRATLEVVLAAMGWTTADFSLAAELKPSEQSRALCNNEIDAIVFVVGHPNKSTREAANGCDVVLVDVSGPAIDKLVAGNRLVYEHGFIPGGIYRGNPKATRTFSVRATVVSSTLVPQDMVYAVVKAVFDDLSAFTRQHPALADLQAEWMVYQGLATPLHPGAARFYRERKLR
ncbi:MAG: TAXI family TRAP transporter solute-binding subunit [Candidatus Methylomirabilales bacterium]